MKIRSLTTSLCILGALCGAGAAESPQHWGMGQGYLAALETREDGTRDLAVYAPPLRAKDGDWLLRWRSPGIAGPQASAWIAVGDFRPLVIGKALLVVATADAGGLTVTVYDPPEGFSGRPWQALAAKSRTITAEQLKGEPLFVAAGNLLGSPGDADRLLVLTRTGTDENDVHWWVSWIIPPMNANQSAEVVRREALPLNADPGSVKGFAAGDFWGTGEDCLCVAVDVDGCTSLRFLRWGKEVSPKACFVKAVDDASGDIPPLAPGGLTAGDFVRDGFDALAMAFDDPSKPLEVRVAPALEPSKPADPGPLYTGRTVARQPVPGAGLDCSAPSMKGRPEGWAGRKAGPLPLAAGQLFGYVRAELTPEMRSVNAVDERPDAEIAFVHRANFPAVAAGEPGYGWPARGETVTWQIVMKNNGAKQIPGGALLRVWLCSTHPNADALGEKPDAEYHIEAMGAYDGDKPKYVIQEVKGPWPYGLEDCPGGKWKRLDFAQTGERWLVATLEGEGDSNERNNRIEVPWHGLPFHPAFRTQKTLGDRQPTVAGDPCSKEYLARKLADAVTGMWERGGTAKNEDALVRVYFDGYEIGWPDDAPEKDKADRWKFLRDCYEGVRQLDAWWGENQTWERFGWKDAGGELRETAALFHPVGDLKAFEVSPVQTGAAAMGDGRPVSIATSCWGPDCFSTGHLVAGLSAAEFARRFTAGSRGANWGGWSGMAPDKVYIRVLDRDGKPVPDAQVSIFPCGKGGPLRSGKTGPDGKFDTGHPSDQATTDVFGRKHWKAGLVSEVTAVVTIGIGRHSEATVLGVDDPCAHGRHALFFHSMLDDKEWVWDVRLNWAPGAAEPDFTLDAAVQGTMVELQVKGPPGRRYRAWRRWEPSWIRFPVGEFPASGEAITILQDLSAPDAWGKGRTRAIYEVAAVGDDGSTGLPRSVSVFALSNALGLSPWAVDRFAVANTNGGADPYGATLAGLAPERELLRHPAGKHTARRLLRSAAKPSRLFVTLKASDTDPAFHLEILDCPPGGMWAPNYDLGGMTTKRGNAKEFRVKDPRQLGELNIGDLVTCNGKSARVSAIVPEAVTLDRPIFDLNTDTVVLRFMRAPGLAGTNAAARELRDPRGMVLLEVGGKEYLAIADTGNARIVIWDPTTKYITGYGGEKFRPVALAIDPRDSRVFFAVDRRADRKSHVLRFTFNGRGIERDHSWNIDAGDWQGDEQGLAVMALHDELDRVRIAVTDGEQARILCFVVAPDRLVPDGAITTVTGPHAGPEALVAPLDCVFIPHEKSARLFVVDGRDRVVEGGPAVK